MISALLYSTLALTQTGLALAAPGPMPTPMARGVLPRFLREAHMLPERGILNDGVITMPIRRTKGQGRNAKRQNIVQVPVADDSGDTDYVRFRHHLLFSEAELWTGNCNGYRGSDSYIFPGQRFVYPPPPCHVCTDKHSQWLGSSDLWAASKSCAGPSGESCVTDSSIPLYSTSSTFQNLSLPLILNYGTSIDLTYNDGTIGTDNVTLAGMTQSQEPFGVISALNS